MSKTWTNRASHSFLFCCCVYFCPYGPFNCISFHKFSHQLSTFSLCSADFNSALLVLSTLYLIYESLSQPIFNPLWLTALKLTKTKLSESMRPFPGTDFFSPPGAILTRSSCLAHWEEEDQALMPSHDLFLDKGGNPQWPAKHRETTPPCTKAAGYRWAAIWIPRANLAGWKVMTRKQRRYRKSRKRNLVSGYYSETLHTFILIRW